MGVQLAARQVFHENVDSERDSERNSHRGVEGGMDVGEWGRWGWPAARSEGGGGGGEGLRVRASSMVRRKRTL